MHERFIFPVGQGGFAFEKIGGFSVIYDCGSLTSPMRVKWFIDTIVRSIVNQVDYLFLSHFDKDHVNCLEYLIKRIKVCNAVVPYIRKDRRIVYNAITYGAYQRIIDLFQYNETTVIELEEGSARTFNLPSCPLWEWTAKSMFKQNDWYIFDQVAIQVGIAVNYLDDPVYVTNNRTQILIVFKKAFGVRYVNAKGLIMLSQKTSNAEIDSVKLWQGETDLSLTEPNTGCLYVGDADLSHNRQLTSVSAFVDSYQTSKPLLFLQIPHHGSKYNSDSELPLYIPASYYFVCDKDDTRILNNSIRSVISNNILLVNDLDDQLIRSCVNVY